jgi:hypothetical protein
MLNKELVVLVVVIGITLLLNQLVFLVMLNVPNVIKILHSTITMTLKVVFVKEITVLKECVMVLDVLPVLLNLKKMLPHIT